MIIKKLLFGIFLFLFTIVTAKSDEVKIESTNIDISDQGNIILAKDAEIQIPSKKLKIKSNKLKYVKNKNIINFSGNVIFNDEINNLTIKGDKINYERNRDLVFSDGDATLNIEKNYKIKSKNIYHDINLNKIYGSEETLVEDKFGNFYFLKKNFEFDLLEEKIKTKKSIILDKNGNKYVFEDLIINLKNNEIAGKEIKIEFDDGYFGNNNNDPILKGRSAYSNKDELKIYKAVFSTCNIKNKKCRGWEVNTKEFNHDKKKKIFEYNDSWLKLFDYKVFFLPYFNHPDPSVKRKSGFLTPSYSTSESLGISLNIPYFKTLSVDKDITFSPRFYANKSFLLQNEYRQALRNSKILSDFSFLIGDAGTKGHFFFNQVGKFNDNTKFELNLQNVKGDNYLKNHKLTDTSKIVKDDNLLISNLDINWNFDKAKLETSFKIFEDLSRNYHDRYQYVFPDFKFSRNLDLPKNYNGKFNFDSYGYNKNYDTNVVEAIITNDFLFSSNDFVNSNGLISNYDILLKNSNSYSNNSTNFDENSSYDLFGTIKLDAGLPMQKNKDNFIHFIKPVVSIMYSPNGNRDLSSKDITLNYNNVFNINRIGNPHQVEGGKSLTAGLEFKRLNPDGTNAIDFKFANVMKTKENIKLPKKSKLNKTRSDIFGNLNYYFSNNYKIGYFFSYDRDLKYSNSDEIDLTYGVNNFITSFSYHTEGNDLEEKENLKNNTSFHLDEENIIKFEIAKDLQDDFTQYYDLIYEYTTDCISVNLKYNKSFYSDGNLEPNSNLTFLVKIIPFTELGVPNVTNIIGN